MRGVSRPYEETHKYINGILHKLCSDCNEWLPIDECFYKNKTAPDGYNPYCKEDTKKRYNKWIEKNPDRKRENTRNWRNKPQNNHIYRNNQNKYVAEGKQKEWQRNHPDKVKGYQNDRNAHKHHEISDEELNELYQYCNCSCLYCGITEKEHLNIYNQKLHKDHAINEGSNGIDNCILACKSCNSSKHDKDWNEWYTPDNPVYTYERYIKIKEWLNKFTI